jgi:chromosome segregation ATPase
MFSGQWPEPQVDPNRIEGGKLIPVMEIERRAKCFEAIEDGHPLMDLIHRCIDNDAQLRPHTSEIARRVSRVTISATFANRLEMLKQIEADEEEKRTLSEEGEKKDKVIQEKEIQIMSLNEEVNALSEEGERKDNVIQEKEREIISLNENVNTKHEHTESAEIDRLKLVHSSEMEQLRLKIRDMNSQSQLTNDETKAEITELESKARTLENQVKTLLEESTRQLTEARREHETKLTREREEYQAQLTNEREVNRKLMADNHDLQAGISKLKSDIDSKLQSEIIERDTTIQEMGASAKRKDSELEAKSRALGEKDAIISAMNEQVTKTREYLATAKQVSAYISDCL